MRSDRRGMVMLDGVSSLPKPLVLVVEDEAPLAMMLRYNLEKQGFRVDEASDQSFPASDAAATY